MRPAAMRCPECSIAQPCACKYYNNAACANDLCSTCNDSVNYLTARGEQPPVSYTHLRAHETSAHL
eukprot:8179248-Alexandrium_andersonii.AAC.1